jgi:anti-anti-sigma factor
VFGEGPPAVIELSVLVVQWEGRCRVYLRGELDLDTAWRLRQDLETAWGVVEFDCSELAFVDCSGLTIWIERWRKDGAIVLINVSSQIRTVLGICGLLEVFELKTSEPASVMALLEQGTVGCFPLAS